MGGLHSDQFLSRVETGENPCVPPKASQHLPGSSWELLEQFTRAVQRTHPSSTGKEHGLRGILRLLGGQMNHLDHLDWLAAAVKDSRQIRAQMVSEPASAQRVDCANYGRSVIGCQQLGILN